MKHSISIVTPSLDDILEPGTCVQRNGASNDESRYVILLNIRSKGMCVMSCLTTGRFCWENTSLLKSDYHPIVPVEGTITITLP